MTLSKNLCLLAISIIIISAQRSVAQNKILFQVKFKPNKTYITNMVNDMQMVMDFDVDSAKKRQMEDGGMKLPMQMNMLQEMTLSTKTGALTTDKRIPMTMTYDKVGMTMTMNGKEMKQPNGLAGTRMKAYATKEGKINIQAVEGNADAAIKESLKKMINQMFRSIEFPNQAMNIGDTFNQEMPMEMPVNGTVLNMLIKVTYTLKEIKNSQAMFDYTQSLNMDVKIGNGNSKATGSGSGTMIYSVPANYITDTTGDMVMNMDMQMGEMNMNMKMKAKTSVKAKVL